MVQIKRVYEAPDKSDGYRVLVDRLWPRGVSKEKAAVDIWLKEMGPSNELREWFGHKPERFAEFSSRYEAEIKANPVTKQLQDIVAEHEVVTLVYSAHDEQANQAVVLRGFLER